MVAFHRKNNQKAYINALSYDDGGEVDNYSGKRIKKAYVSIRVESELKPLLERDEKYRYDYAIKPKVFKELYHQKLKGVIGISTNKWNVSNWFHFRDCLIVMDFKKFKAINNAKQVIYNDPDYLMANDMDILFRLSDRKERDIQSKIDIIQNFSKHLVAEFGSVPTDSTSLSREWGNLEYAVNPYQSSAFFDYIRRKNPIINSPKDFALVLLDYVKDPEEKRNLLHSNDLTHQITVKDLIPYIEEGIKRQGKVFKDEGEWILTDKTLNIPEGSQLFFKADEENDSRHYLGQINSNKSIALKETIKEFDLYSKYKVFFVKSSDIERYARQQLDVKEKIFKQELEERKQKHNQNKLDVLNEIKELIKDDFAIYVDSILEKKSDGSLETYRHKEKEWEDDNPYPYRFIDLPFYKELIQEIDICIDTVINDLGKRPVTETTGYDIEHIHTNVARCLNLKNRKLESLLQEQDNYENSSGYESNNHWWGIKRFFDFISDDEGNLFDANKYKSIYKAKIFSETHRLYPKDEIWKFKKGGVSKPVYGVGNKAESLEEIHKGVRGNYSHLKDGIVVQNLFHGTCKPFRKFDATKKGSATADDLMSLLGFSFSPSVEKVFEYFAGENTWEKEQEKYAVEECSKEFTEEQVEEEEDEWMDCISEVRHNAPLDCRAITVNLTGKKILTTSETDLNKYGLRLLQKSGELKKLEKQEEQKVINKLGTRFKDVMLLPNGYYDLKKNNWELSNQRAKGSYYYSKTWKELRVAMAKAIWKDLLAQGYDIIRYENEVEIDKNEPFDYIPYSTKQIKPLERIYDDNYMGLEIVDYKQGGVPINYWGNSGSGVLLKAKDTGRYLVVKRSEWVNEPNTWGIISGSRDGDETPIQTALRELKEETGIVIQPKDLQPNYVFKDGDFTFHNFIGTVDKEFKPILDWENSDYMWTDLENLPTPTHFGLQKLVANKFEEGGAYEGWQESRQAVTEMPVIGKVATPFHNLAKGIDKVTGGKSEILTDPIGGAIKKSKMEKGGSTKTHRDKYNEKYGYKKGSSHSLKEISKKTGVSMKGLQKIYNKGVGARKTNPQSVRSLDGKKRGGKSLKGKMSAEQWAMARVYSAVMGGKASEVDAKELKMEKGGQTNTEYQFRDIGGVVQYYKRENGGKWHFISRKEFLQDARRENIVMESEIEKDNSDWQNEYRELERDMFKLYLKGVRADNTVYQAMIQRRAELEKQKMNDGGIVEGQLHSECNDETGCGEKFDVGNSGHIIEVERDEAVIVPNAFNDNSTYEIQGTPSQIASALNSIGGGKDFDNGALVNGKQLSNTKQTSDTDVDSIDGNSIIINRRSMYDKNIYKAKGTPKQIASQINHLNDNGVKITEGGSIEKA